MPAIASAATAAVVAYATFGESVHLALELRGARPAAERVAGLWRTTGPNAGAFVSATRLDPPFDLYASAWALRLTTIYHLPIPPSVNKRRLTEALRASLENPGSVQSLPELEVLRRTVAAMRDLGLDPPKEVVANRLADFRTPDGYSMSSSGPGSIVALSAAVEIDSLSELPIPDELRAEIAALIDSGHGSETSLQDLADRTIPSWIAADIALTPHERAHDLVNLQGGLQSLWGQLAAAQAWDGPTLSLAAAAVSVSRANGIEVPQFDGSIWAPLMRADGLLQLSSEVGDADLQTTVSAAELGMTLPPNLAHTLAGTATALGWRTAAIGGPVEASMAAMVLRKLRIDDHRDELARSAGDWLASMKQDITDGPTLRQHVRDLAMYNALGGSIGTPRWMPSASAWADVETWTTADQQWLARAFLLSGVRPPNKTISDLTDASNRDPTSAHDAFGIFLVGSLADSSVLKQKAVQYLDSVRLDGLYLARPDAPTPDLQSTAVGYAIKGQTSFGAARRFDTTAGFAMLADPGATGDAGSLQSAFYAFGLATGFENLASIP